jgi:hypothetical protein
VQGYGVPGRSEVTGVKMTKHPPSLGYGVASESSEPDLALNHEGMTKPRKPWSLPARLEWPYTRRSPNEELMLILVLVLILVIELEIRHFSVRGGRTRPAETKN